MPVLSLCYKVKRIIRILIIALFFSASVARSQVSSKAPVNFSRKAAKKHLLQQHLSFASFGCMQFFCVVPGISGEVAACMKREVT